MAERSESAAAAPRRRRLRWPTIAESAFLLSLSLAALNAAAALRGAVIIVQPPEQVILFRDGEGAKAVLTFAMRAAMINATPEHGDVVMAAKIAPSAHGPFFGSDATLQPVFTSDPGAAAKCELGARCVSLKGLLAVERADEIVDLPGGGVKARYFSFPAARWNCEADQGMCAAFATFDTAAAALTQAPLSLRLRIWFHGDGERELSCEAGRLDLAYLQRTGWAAISCKQAAVKRLLRLFHGSGQG